MRPSSINTYTIGEGKEPSWLGVRFETPTDCYIKYLQQTAKVGDKITIETYESGTRAVKLTRKDHYDR